MLGLIGLRRGMKVLEIGCGCGYTSALMAAAGARVFTVENQGFLAQSTRKRLDRLNFQNVIIHRADGEDGWKEHAPYDCVLVSKITREIPNELFGQLKKPGGRLLAPIGDATRQTLTLWELSGELKRYALEPCNIEGA
jgi:protein-L-isoaspartate(D-aspartate) O-methyltransferase